MNNKPGLNLLLVAPLALILFWTQQLMVHAQTLPAAGLTGQVSSQEEGPMEGVLVTVRREGATYTTTVVSDVRGQYSFPTTRLQPGVYSVTIRAAGYQLPAPAQITLSAQKTSQLDLKLQKAGDIAYQLSNGEWLLSMSGTQQQKQQYLGCVGCHTLERVLRTRYNALEFAHVVDRMGTWSQGSTPLRPQRRPDFVNSDIAMGRAKEPSKRAMQFGEFASTVNLSKASRWGYELKTLPRPTGKGTRVIMTEYDLPRPESLPHDAIVDKDGMVWYGDFGSQFLGRLDPSTGETVEYPIPVTVPDYPKGNLDMNFDPDGNIYMGMMFQGVVMKFDTQKKSWESWKNPKIGKGDDSRTAMVTPARVNVDGKIWVGSETEYQLDIKTGVWTAIDYTRGVPQDRIEEASKISSYGVAADSKNNFYGLELSGDHITRVDAKTMNVTLFRTPTPDSGPRRGRVDSQDRLWFGEYRGNRIGMFDTRTEMFREWEIPVAWTNPYDAVLDKDGYVWGGGMTNDYVARIDTQTDEITMYLLPGTTNIRRVEVDNSTSPPTFWVGDNLEGTLIRVEPLE